MKFKVRDGYTVTITTQKQINENGRTITRPQDQQYFGGDVFDATRDQAIEQAARVEPMDAEAEAFMASQVAVVPPSPAVGSQEFNDAVAAAVAAALAAAGVKTKA